MIIISLSNVKKSCLFIIDLFSTNENRAKYPRPMKNDNNIKLTNQSRANKI